MSETGAAKELKELLSFLYLIPAAIMKTDGDGEVIMANPECVRVLSPIFGTMIENLFQFVDERDPEFVRLMKSASIGGSVVKERRVMFLTDAGECVLSFDVFRTTSNELLVAFRDVSQLVSHERRLELAARTDSLTGLANRRAFTARVKEELERQDRYDRKLALVMADADHFKHINDVHGHAAGDAVLVAIAQHFRQALRTCDIAARIGGEEFVILLPETDRAGGRRCAERIAAAIRAKPANYDGTAIPFTMSFGVAARLPGDSGDALINRADRAMYAAKANGRDQIVLADFEPPV